MKKKSKILYSVLVLFTALLLLFGLFFERKPVYVLADTSDEINFDSTYVMDDLVGSTVDGEPFNLKDYAFDKTKPTKIFSFVEYCYSFNATKQGNYGLYVYVYNPQGLNFVFDSVQNKIQFAVGEGATEYQKYSLQFLNCSSEKNFEGLFIKYKVLLSSARKDEVLSALNSTNRVYRVSGIELLIDGKANATDYPATGVVTADNKGSVIYNYSGYSAGYGPNIAAESTLTVDSTEGDVLRLEVHHTSWREKGVTNGKDQYTQDSLNSVYFAVPKTIVNKYGYLSEVHAEWLNAITNLGLVTGNYDVYKAIYPYVGQYIPPVKSGETALVPYSVSYGFTPANSGPLGFGVVLCTANSVYSPDVLWSGYHNTTYSENGYLNLISQLNWLFYAGVGLNSADSAVISSEKITKWYQSEFRKVVGENYGEVIDCKDGIKVYKALFESVDDEIKDYHIKADENQTLVSQKWSQTWWEKHVTGNYHKDGGAIPTDVECIHLVTDDDFGTNEQMTCDNLYISTSDYDNFKQFYDDNKEDKNVYLMRFAVTDYMSREAVEMPHGGDGWSREFDSETGYDTNAYFFKQSVFLDFDIIDVTFDNGKVKTVIPVVSSPIDILPETTPPVFVTEDKEKFDWDKLISLILGVVLLVLLVVVVVKIVIPFFKWLFKGFHKKE